MSITKEMTVAEILTENVGADHVFSKYKIDFCCGGDMRIEDVCLEQDVSFKKLKLEIEAVKKRLVGNSNLASLDLNSLVVEASTVNHKYFNESISQLLPLAALVAEVHGRQHKEVIEINILFSKAVSEITEQLSHEENNLFPFIKDFIGNQKTNYQIEPHIATSLEQSIKRITGSYADAADIFKTISKLSMNFSIPEGACNSFKFFYEKLEEFEHALHKYIHFEKNVFFPKLLKLI